MKIPDPVLNEHWSLENRSDTQLLLLSKSGCRLAIDLRESNGKHILMAAGVHGDKIKMSGSVFRDALPSLFPQCRWGKLPRSSRFGFRAMAELKEAS